MIMISSSAPVSEAANAGVGSATGATVSSALAGISPCQHFRPRWGNKCAHTMRCMHACAHLLELSDVVEYPQRQECGASDASVRPKGSKRAVGLCVSIAIEHGVSSCIRRRIEHFVPFIHRAFNHASHHALDRGFDRTFDRALNRPYHRASHRESRQVLYRALQKAYSRPSMELVLTHSMELVMERLIEHSIEDSMSSL